MIVSFEGVDGVGKSSVIQWLFNHLHGGRVWMIRNPHDDKDLVRLLDTTKTLPSSLLAHEAGNFRLLDEVLWHLRQEDSLGLALVDRWWDSTQVYQMEIQPVLHGNKKQLMSIHTNCLDMARKELVKAGIPWMTIILHDEPELIQKRIASRGESVPSIKWINEVQEQYIQISTRHPKRVKMMPVNGRSIATLGTDILMEITKWSRLSGWIKE